MQNLSKTMWGRQPLKTEEYFNMNWLSEHFHPPGEKGRFQAEVIICPELIH